MALVRTNLQNGMPTGGYGQTSPFRQTKIKDPNPDTLEAQATQAAVTQPSQSADDGLIPYTGPVWGDQPDVKGPNVNMGEPAPTTGGTATGNVGGDPQSSGYRGNWLGFDMNRAGATGSGAGSLKYDAMNVLGKYNPSDYAKDPTLRQTVLGELNALHPGEYELDEAGNIMLTGTADGYIGARPENRASDWTDYGQPWAWQWMAYNDAHPGPKGETGGAGRGRMVDLFGGTGVQAGEGGSALKQLLQMLLEQYATGRAVGK